MVRVSISLDLEP